MPWGFPDTFEIEKVAPVSPWAAPNRVEQPSPKPDFADDETLKRAYGVELGKGLTSFDAGVVIFAEATANALWISTNWITDPIVIAAKDAYEKTAKSLEKPLDKEQLLSKILTFIDQKDTNGRPLVEAKEVLQGFKLYAEVQGFIGKIDTNASTNTINNSNTNNFTKIVLVKAEDKSSPKTIDNNSNTQSKISNVEVLPIPLKLVGGASR